MVTTKFVRIDLGSEQSSFARVDGDDLWLLAGAPWDQIVETGRVVQRQGARLLAPVVNPTKIVCIGRNYKEHAEEFGNEVPAEPIIFFKPPSSIVGPDATIELPRESNRVDHEGELGVIISKRARHVPVDRALDFVFGYTCVNDVTARDLQAKDGQWARAKGFDTFCPIGPEIVTGLDPRALSISCSVNGVTKQNSNTRDMIFGVAELIAFITGVMTLEPGDVISTGTPSGVSPLQGGDIVEVQIEGIGVLRNQVRSPV